MDDVGRRRHVDAVGAVAGRAGGGVRLLSAIAL